MATMGFDPKRTDLPDYILGITREIPEDRGVAAIHRHYARDTIERGSRRTVEGAQAVIDGTDQSIADSPDLHIHVEDLIWSGDKEDGVLPSCRVLGAFSMPDGDGRPMGRPIRERAIARTHDRAAHLTHPGGRTGHRATEADRFWVALRAACPTAELIDEHRIGREDPMMPPRSAVNRSLKGRHEGRGLFGPPTRAPVAPRGASHAEMAPWGLGRDCVPFDEAHV